MMVIFLVLVLLRMRLCIDILLKFNLFIVGLKLIILVVVGLVVNILLVLGLGVGFMIGFVGGIGFGCWCFFLVFLVLVLMLVNNKVEVKELLLSIVVFWVLLKLMVMELLGGIFDV